MLTEHVRVAIRHPSGDPARARPAYGKLLLDGSFEDSATGNIYKSSEFYRSRTSSETDEDEITK